MYKYKVKYNGNTYYYMGDHCDDAASKLQNRKVFGNYLCGDLQTKLYDADTRGEKWAKYGEKCTGKTVSIERE